MTIQWQAWIPLKLAWVLGKSFSASSRLCMKANTFPFTDGGNAAILAAARNSIGPLNPGGGSFRSTNVAHRNLQSLGSVKTQNMPRNLPKLDARSVPSLPQIDHVRRMPGGMQVPSGGVNSMGMMKPRKLAPLGSVAADKGKQLLNNALDIGSEKKKKKKHRHRDKKSKRKHKRRHPGSDVDATVANKETKQTSQKSKADPVEEAAEQARRHLCELLDTQKGRGILMQEAKIRKAFREGLLVDLHFQREPNQSLGIAFNIPARVSAMNWISQQRLIVGNIKKESPAEIADMKIDDIVARIDDDECKSIVRFKDDINGKTSFTITVARCKGVTVEDIRKVRNDIESQVMETARQRARDKLEEV